jgi:hypothetical protein
MNLLKVIFGISSWAFTILGLWTHNWRILITFWIGCLIGLTVGAIKQIEEKNENNN